MTYSTFEELNDAAMALYREQRFGEVYDLLTDEGIRFPHERYTVLYLRSCMAARTGLPEQAIGLIGEAFDSGLWYGEMIMRETPSWAGLQGNPEFEYYVALGKERAAATEAAAQMLVEEPREACGRPGCPLVLALHGNTQNAKLTINGWRGVVEQGRILAAIDSGQAAGTDQYIWDDQERAVREVVRRYEELQATRRFDPDHVTVAGFSYGGETALRVALTGAIPARNFILLGPGGAITSEHPDDWLPIIKGAAGKGLRGYIFVGANEPEPERSYIEATARMLNEGGIPTGFEFIPGIAHVYPRDFGPLLRRAFDFVDRTE